MFSQIDRILPFILAESIKADLGLSDTEMGLLTGFAFAVCYSLLLAAARPRLRSGVASLRPGFVHPALERHDGVSAALPQAFCCWPSRASASRFGEAGAVPAGHALIARKIRPERRGLAIGLFAMGIPLGTMVGFAVGGAVGDTLGWRIAMIGAGAIGGLIALLTFLVTGPTPTLERTARQQRTLRGIQSAIAGVPDVPLAVHRRDFRRLRRITLLCLLRPVLFIRTHGFSARRGRTGVRASRRA